MNLKTTGGSKNSENNAYADKFSQITGWPIQTTSTNKKTGEVNQMETTNFTKGSIPADIKSTEGYNLMKMPDFGNSMFGE